MSQFKVKITTFVRYEGRHVAPRDTTINATDYADAVSIAEAMIMTNTADIDRKCAVCVSVHIGRSIVYIPIDEIDDMIRQLQETQNDLNKVLDRHAKQDRSASPS